MMDHEELNIGREASLKRIGLELFLKSNRCTLGFVNLIKYNASFESSQDYSQRCLDYKIPPLSQVKMYLR